jgi:subtilisin
MTKLKLCAAAVVLAIVAAILLAFAATPATDPVSRSLARPVWAFAQVLPTGVDRVEADSSEFMGIDGVDERLDIDIAILDTGIDLYHPDLDAHEGVNCIDPDALPMDGHGHGTHVAGTIGALDNDFGVVGVLPGARVWAVKVLDDAGGGTYGTVACGIDWVTEHADEIDVINLSLGGLGSDDGDCGYSDGDILHQAICQAVDAGVVVVVAAGNSYSDSSRFVPAAYDEVITVSALADFDGAPGGDGLPTCRVDLDDTFADFSNFGADVDIAAPGVCIRSTYRNGGYATLSGTSMASPHVAAIAGLHILSMGKPEDGAGVEAIKAEMLATSFPQDSGWGFWGDPDAFPEPLANANPDAQAPPPGPPPPPPPLPPPQDGVYDLAVVSVSTDKTEVYRPYVVYISTSVENQGTEREMATIRAFAGDIEVGIRTRWIPAEWTATERIPWVTDGFPAGLYEIRAEVDPIGGETDLSDNSLTDGSVEVKNRAPVARITTDSHPEIGEPHLFDGSESYDPDGTIDAYEWEITNYDGTRVVATGSGVEWWYTFTSEDCSDFYGFCWVVLTVTDSDGATAYRERLLKT